MDNLLNLIEGTVYEVTFPGYGEWAEFKTMMRFHKKFANGYCFFILNEQHLKLYQQGHDVNHNYITYDPNLLVGVKFETSPALQVLYAEKDKK